MVFRAFANKPKRYRCRIVGIDKGKILVMIDGIKAQLVSYSPEKLVTQDKMLNEFSPFDVRAITFYALENETKRLKNYSRYFIVGQEINEGKTVFIIDEMHKKGEQRKTAQVLYREESLLRDFNPDDLKVIISTAVQEQTINDIQTIYA